MNYRSYMELFGIKSGRNNEIWAFRACPTGRIGSPTGRSLLLVIFGQVLPVGVKSYR